MDFGLLLLRVFIGLQVAAHGSQKLWGWFKGHGLDATSDMFHQMGMQPGRFFAVSAGMCELGGGLLLLLGLVTPLGAAAIIAVMLTAIVTVHLDKGFFAHQGGFELPLLLAVSAASIAFTGPGKASLDHAIGWNFAGWYPGIFAIVVGVAGSLIALASRAFVKQRVSA